MEARIAALAHWEGWADGVWDGWAEEDGVPVAAPAEAVVSGGWEERYPMPHAPWLKLEEEKPQQAQAAVEQQTSVDEVVEPQKQDYDAIATQVEGAAREAFLKEHARLMAEEAIRKAKRRRNAETILLFM